MLTDFNRTRLKQDRTLRLTFVHDLLQHLPCPHLDAILWNEYLALKVQMIFLVKLKSYQK